MPVWLKLLIAVTLSLIVLGLILSIAFWAMHNLEWLLLFLAILVIIGFSYFQKQSKT